MKDKFETKELHHAVTKELADQAVATYCELLNQTNDRDDQFTILLGAADAGLTIMMNAQFMMISNGFSTKEKVLEVLDSIQSTFLEQYKLYEKDMKCEVPK